MKCISCGEYFNCPGSNICGNCADDLRDEEFTNILTTEAADDIAKWQYEDAERRAYEAEERSKAND